MPIQSIATCFDGESNRSSAFLPELAMRMGFPGLSSQYQSLISEWASVSICDTQTPLKFVGCVWINIQRNSFCFAEHLVTCFLT